MPAGDDAFQARPDRTRKRFRAVTRHGEQRQLDQGACGTEFRPERLTNVNWPIKAQTVTNISRIMLCMESQDNMGDLRGMRVVEHFRVCAVRP